MSGRAGVWAVLGAIAAVACDAAPPPPARAPLAGPPDVVLVSIDSLRADHLGTYGYRFDTSPTIDGLAAEGVRFENAISTTSWTLAAHAALFTGLYDSAHGVIDDSVRLADGHRTLAEALREVGYQTAGFFGGPYLHPTWGLDQGFEHYESCMTVFPDDLGEEELRRDALSARGRSHSDVTGPRTVERVAHWLARADARPLFLFVHLWDVHFDYIPPREYVERFDPDYRGELRAVDFMQNPAITPAISERDLRHLLALYDGEIRFTDDQLARLLALLEPRGRLANTMVWITADHGDEFFEHGGKGHRRTLFDEVIRVPLVVRWPERVPAGGVVVDQVRLVDVMPTILALAGAETDGAFQGRDLSPLLEGQKLPAAPALAELHLPEQELLALRTNRQKLVSSAGRFAFFDLVADPHELRPRGALAPGFGAARAALEAERRAALGFAAARALAGEPVAPDPEVQRRLESLGYLEPTGRE